jgi:UPF0716 family protein affecting phage T7 exclusion
MNILMRALAGAGAFLLIDSGLVTDIAGLAILLLILFSQKFFFGKKASAA